MNADERRAERQRRKANWFFRAWLLMLLAWGAAIAEPQFPATSSLLAAASLLACFAAEFFVGESL